MSAACAEIAERAFALAEALRARGAARSRLALVLGSGLGAFAEHLSASETIPFAELPGMPGSAVPGHAGRIVLGELDGVPVLVQSGRVHLYEGWSAHAVTRSVRAYASLGIPALLLTNAAGGLRPEWLPGTLMRIVDHLALQGLTPLLSGERSAGTPYDAELGRALERSAAASGVELEAGVYAGLLGPSYETPAEIRMLAWMGADAVGMSTVAEAATAAVLGMRVCAVSCITNLAAGLSETAPSHAEVLEVGREAAGRFTRLLEAAVPALAKALARTANTPRAGGCASPPPATGSNR